MFSFSFLLELNCILRWTHELSFFSVQYCQKSLLPHVLKETGVHTFFFFFFFYITIWQNCCSHKKNALSSNQQVVETMNDKALCWRQHLTLHMKTLCYPTAFELPTLSLHYRKTFGQKESNLFSL